MLGTLQPRTVDVQLSSSDVALQDCTDTVMCSFPMPCSKKRPSALTTTRNLRIPRYKVPRHTAFELTCTTIRPNPMMLGPKTSLNNTLPMQRKAVLHEIAIMFHIIRNVEVIGCDIPSAFIVYIWVRISYICDMHKNANLVAMPMHRLDFILYLKGVVLSIVNH